MSEYLRLLNRLDRIGLLRMTDHELRALLAETQDRIAHLGRRDDLAYRAEAIALELARRGA